MVLQAYGLDVTNERIRAIANQLQGTYGYNDGIALGYLAEIAQQAGLRTEGLTLPNGKDRQWTMGDVIREIRHGHPVITLVHYASLPDHATSLSKSDHYIVIVGVTSKGFVINDPAFTGDDGYRRLLTPDQLMTAWHNASIQQQGVAFLPPNGKSGLKPLNAAVAAPARSISNNSAEAAPQSALVASAGAVVQPATILTDANPVAPVPLFLTPTPSPNPTIVAWTSALGSWQHEAAISPTQATVVTDSTGRFTLADQAVVMADRSSNSNLLPSLVVLALIGIVAVAIIKAPGREEE